ncbi:MAG: SagB/ThcOx family dehydrogenase [Gammaproteobacteria bacterium]
MESKMSIHPTLINSATHLNGYSPFVPWSNSIGLKPNILRYAERFQSNSLAEDFLLNSYYNRGDFDTESSMQIFYDEACVVMQSLLNKRDYTGLKKIVLSDAVPLNMNLGEAIIRRRSIREFTGDTIPSSYLATIARAAQGYSDSAVVKLPGDGEVELNFCTVSSGGHLYPIDLYFVALNIKGLEIGVYLYSNNEDALFKIGDETLIKQILASFSVPEDYFLQFRANYFCLFVAHPWRSMCKYGNRGLRFVLHEIGSIAQNIHLTNVCLGLGSIDWGSYFENEINNALSLDGVNQTVLHMVLAGIVG